MKPMKKSDRFAKVVNNDGKAAEKVNPRLNILPGSSISSGLIERVWGQMGPIRMRIGFSMSASAKLGPDRWRNFPADDMLMYAR